MYSKSRTHQHTDEVIAYIDMITVASASCLRGGFANICVGGNPREKRKPHFRSVKISQPITIALNTLRTCTATVTGHSSDEVLR